VLALPTLIFCPEQDELIDRLRKENEAVNRTYLVALKFLVALSFILCVFKLIVIRLHLTQPRQLTTFKNNPLLTIYPIRGPAPSIPLPVIFTILSLFIHLNLAFSFSLETIKLPYQLMYSLSAVAPTLSLFLQKPWQTTVWWCVTPLVVYINQTVMDAFQETVQGISDLEQMKYTAPGA